MSEVFWWFYAVALGATFGFAIGTVRRLLGRETMVIEGGILLVCIFVFESQPWGFLAGGVVPGALMYYVRVLGVMVGVVLGRLFALRWKNKGAG